MTEIDVRLNWAADQCRQALLEKAYDLYRLDWGKIRGFDPDVVKRAFDRDQEYKGQMYVCLGEFEDCEFVDEDYMSSLLPPELFRLYLAVAHIG